MKYKSFAVGDIVKYWNPKNSHTLDCMDVRTGKVVAHIVNDNEDVYVLKVRNGPRLTMSASSVSSANGGHYCKLGPCASGRYECPQLPKCRACQ